MGGGSAVDGTRATKPAGGGVVARPADLRIELLGGFRVACGARAVPAAAWRRRKAAALVKLLALAPGHRLHREQVYELLWPEFDPDAAANNLHRTLHAARRALEPDLGPAVPSAYLRLHGGELRLASPRGLWIDVAAFETAAAGRAGDPAAVPIEAALALYGGDLLPEDRYEEWAADRRDRLRGVYLALLLELARQHEARLDLAAAIAVLQRATAADPLSEAAHLGLMRLYSRIGDRQRALQQYDELRAALRRDLDAEPDAVAQRLRDDLLAATDAIPSVPPPQASPSLRGADPPADAARRSNLPTSITSFVGREREVAEVRRLLAGTRLLTLIGAGGCGKTRLAVEVAATPPAADRDGALLVELAPVATAAGVPGAVAAALALTEEPGRPALSVLIDHLAPRRLLLILDNCEHHVAACARLAESLLRGCPHLRVLATSREALGIGGELAWRVPSLSVPALSPPPTPASLAESDAVALFVARAGLSQVGFAVTVENAAAVARVCAQLDGIPLAIELAAARLRLLSVAQLADRLDDALGLLVHGSRTVLPRHQTLRGVLDWSHRLLDPPERAVFRRLATFADGWTLEAAEVVCAGEGVAATDVLDVLGRLVDKSLTVAEFGPTGARQRFLEPIRQYAHAHLRAAPEATAAEGRHLGWFLALAERAAPELRGPDQGAWLDRLDAEHGNLRAALAGAVARGDGRGVALAAALWEFWETRGHLSEGRAWLDQVLALGGEPLARARALNGLGNLVSDLGDPARAGELYGAALALARDLDDRSTMLSATNNLGNLAMLAGDRPRAAGLYAEALAVARDGGDGPRAAAALDNLGVVAQADGRYAAAAAHHDEARTLYHAAGDARGVAAALASLGSALWGQGLMDRSAPVLDQALALARELDDRWSTAVALTYLGNVCRDAGDPARAATWHREALTLWSEQGVPAGIADALDGLGVTLAATGDARAATRLLAAAAATRATVGAERYPAEQSAVDRTLARLREQLTAPVFDAVWLAAQSDPVAGIVADARAGGRDDRGNPAPRLRSGAVRDG